MIGKMNRRVILYNESYTQDIGGGTKSVETERWTQWADIKDRSGNSSFSQSQDMVVYDYKVKVRFDGRVNSNTGMIYEGQVCKMQSMTVESEGYKHFLVLRFSKTDTYVDIS